MQTERKHALFSNGVQAYLDHLTPLDKPLKRDKPGWCTRMAVWLGCMGQNEARSIRKQLAKYERTLAAAHTARAVWLTGLREQVRAAFQQDKRGQPLAAHPLLSLSTRQLRRLTNGELQDRISAFRTLRDEIERQRTALVREWEEKATAPIPGELRQSITQRRLDDKLGHGEIPARYAGEDAYIVTWGPRKFLDAYTRANLGQEVREAVTGKGVEREPRRVFDEKQQKSGRSPVAQPRLPKIESPGSADMVCMQDIDDCIQAALSEARNVVTIHRPDIRLQPAGHGLGH